MYNLIIALVITVSMLSANFIPSNPNHNKCDVVCSTDDEGGGSDD